MRMVVPALILLILVSAAPATLLAEGPAEPAFAVDPEKAVLEIDGRRIPASRAAPPRPEFRVQGLRIEVEGATFRAFRGESTEPAWAATAGGADSIQVLADTPSRLLTRWWKKGEGRDWTCIGGEGLLRPLSLADGKWGAALVLGEGENQGIGPDEAVREVEDGPAGTAVLCTVRGGSPRLEAGITAWRVLFLPPGAAAPAWTVSGPSAGSFPGASWMRGDGGGYHRSDVRGLSLAGDSLVVCAGPLEDVLVLAAADGKERARLERAWEFRPGQPDPPALPTPSPPRRADPPGGAGAKEDGGPRSRILAGPVVVPHRERPEYGDGAVDTFRVFVATAVDLHDIDGYAMDGYLLELDASLAPLAMSPLPRLPAGTLRIEGSASADFRLEGGGILRATPSFQRDVHGSKEMGTGRRIRISLLHEPAPAFLDGYMTTGGLGAFFADERGMLTASAGGRIASKNSGEMELPLEVFDFAGRGERRALLRLPIRGPVPRPETNYSESFPRGEGGTSRIESKDPHIAVIRGFQRAGNRIRIRVWVQGRENLDIDFEVGGG